MLHPWERLPALSRQTGRRSLARAGCCSATLNPLSLVTAGLLCAILSPGLFLCLPEGHECQERPVEHSSVCFLPGRSPGQDQCHLLGALRGSPTRPVMAATCSSPEGQGPGSGHSHRG